MHSLHMHWNPSVPERGMLVLCATCTGLYDGMHATCDSCQAYSDHLQRSDVALQMKKGMQRANNGDNSAPISLQSSKPIVLVLGSGWGAHSLIKASLQLPPTTAVHLSAIGALRTSATALCPWWPSYDCRRDESDSILGGETQNCCC